ncbi:MAG TPA: O-antigen ligase family protein [Methylomirabilota bacterium]|nr:O-antigen ligase family protein [Methylomirabilota bacterium]
MTLAGAADRAAPVLLAIFLLALTVSISAAQLTLGLLTIAELCRLTQYGRRAAYRLPLLAPLLAFVAVTMLSAAFSLEPRRAFFEAKDLLLIVTFYLAVNGVDDETRGLKLLRWFFVAVVIISLYGLLQIVACRSDIPIPAWEASLLRVKLDACRAAPFFRAKGLYSIYMTYAGVLLLAVTVMLAFITLLPWRRVWGIGGSALIAMLALGGTFVRGAWIGLVVSFSILYILTRRLRLIGLAVIPIVLALLASSSVRERMQSVLDSRDATAEERVQFWRAGARMVRDHPWLGVGPGHVHLLYPNYRDADARRPTIGHLHNNVIQIAAERGLLGLGAWLWVWAAFMTRASRIYRQLPSTALERRAVVGGSLAAVVALFVAGLFEYNFGDSEVQMLLWVVMALPFAVRAWPGASADSPAEGPHL